jgi:hypothetical protein
VQGPGDNCELHRDRLNSVLFVEQTCIALRVFVYASAAVLAWALKSWGILLGAVIGSEIGRLAVNVLIELVVRHLQGAAPWHCTPHGWTRFGWLLGHCVPRGIRQHVYEPSHNEILDDYLSARPRCRSKSARIWLSLCLTVRTVLLLVDCWRVWAAAKTAGVLVNWILKPVKRWWVS